MLTSFRKVRRHLSEIRPDKKKTKSVKRKSLNGLIFVLKKITSDASSKLKGPVGNVQFSFCNSLKLIVAQPVASPNENVRRLPSEIQKNFIFPNYFGQQKWCMSINLLALF